MTEVTHSKPGGRPVHRMSLMLESGIAIVAGWCVGMLAAYGVIVSNAKIGSGPLAHPAATWFVGVRSAVFVIILAIVLGLSLGRSRKRLLLGAAIGMATPLGTLFWLYS